LNSSIKSKIYSLLETPNSKNSFGWYFDIFIISLILLNAIAIILESVSSIQTKYYQWFYYFELFSVIVFTTELILRLYSITFSQKFRHPIKGRIKYLFTPFAIIDILAVIPFYLSFILPDLRFIRILRILRLARLLKVFRFINAVSIIDDVFRAKKDELIISFIIIAKILFISSTIMYYCEHDVQPEKFSSIPQTLWWGVMTLTTVGYGDVYPITTMGRITGGFVSLLCIGLFALPTGILASGFSEQIANRKRNRKIDR